MLPFVICLMQMNWEGVAELLLPELNYFKQIVVLQDKKTQQSWPLCWLLAASQQGWLAVFAEGQPDFVFLTVSLSSWE